MLILVDGHNLIPKLGGSLKALDDEQRLVMQLQAYARQTRHSVEVFFDQAPPGFSGQRAYGTVKAHFVRQGRTADEAIRLRLIQLGAAARNARVVTSDRQVQAEARAHQAGVISSEDFARQVLEAVYQEPASPERPAGAADDLDEWLALFGGDGEEGPPPIMGRPPRGRF